MAIFYYPTRGAPTTTLTIAALESYASDRPRDILQGRDITPGGAAIVYNLGTTIQLLNLKIALLSLADKNSLVSFIDTKAVGASNSFDFTDDQGTQYDGCRCWFDDYDFSQIFLEHFSEELLLRVD